MLRITHHCSSTHHRFSTPDFFLLTLDIALRTWDWSIGMRARITDQRDLKTD